MEAVDVDAPFREEAVERDLAARDQDHAQCQDEVQLVTHCDERCDEERQRQSQGYVEEDLAQQVLLCPLVGLEFALQLLALELQSVGLHSILLFILSVYCLVI